MTVQSVKRGEKAWLNQSLQGSLNRGVAAVSAP